MAMRHVQVFLLFLCYVLAFILIACLSNAIVVMAAEDELDWSSSGESLVLSAYLWGFCVSPLGGGWLVRRMGAKRVLLLALLPGSLLSFLLPLTAQLGGWPSVCALRVAQGLFLGTQAPATHALLAQWAPPAERARFGSFAYGGCNLGTMLGLLLSGCLCASWGWPSVFYTSGALGLVACAAWAVLGADSPAACRRMSHAERELIASAIASSTATAKVARTPWRAILLSPPVWSMIVVQCGQFFGFWTFVTELPSYMKYVQGYAIAENGLVTALPYFALWLAAIPLSWLSDVLVNRKLVAVTPMRKLANGIGEWGGGAVLVALGCGAADSSPTLAVLLLTLAMVLLASMMLGVQINHLDLSPNHADALIGLSNCLANLVSAFAPIVASFIVTDEADAGQWHTLFLTAAAIYFVTNSVYLLFGSGELQPWNEAGLQNQPVEGDTCTGRRGRTLPA